MLADPEFADLPLVAYAEPAPVFSTVYATPDMPVRACPDWKRCRLCQGTGSTLGGLTFCPACDCGVIEIATGEPL